MTTIVREMKPDDIEEASCFLREHFNKHEPLLQTQELNVDPNRRECNESIVQLGASLVAVDQGRGDRIVGVAYVGTLNDQDMTQSWLASNAEERTQFMQHVKFFLLNIEKNANFFELYGVTEALYLKMVAVDASMRGRGLGRRLVSALIDVARTKGYALLVATCTSLYSAKLMASLGMDCVHSELYADFKDKAGNVPLKPLAPHTKASVMALKL